MAMRFEDDGNEQKASHQTDELLEEPRKEPVKKPPTVPVPNSSKDKNKK